MPLILPTILRHWRLVLTGLGFAILGIMLANAKAGERHWHKEADNKAALLAQERRGRVADRKACADGQIATAKLHAAQKAADEALHETIRKDADHAYQPQLAAARALARERLRLASGADQSLASGAHLPGSPESAVQSDRSGVGAVILTADDADRCTVAVTRLLNARDWALSIEGKHE